MLCVCVYLRVCVHMYSAQILGSEDMVFVCVCVCAYVCACMQNTRLFVPTIHIYTDITVYVIYGFNHDEHMNIMS